MLQCFESFQNIILNLIAFSLIASSNFNFTIIGRSFTVTFLCQLYTLQKGGGGGVFDKSQTHGKSGCTARLQNKFVY